MTTEEIAYIAGLLEGEGCFFMDDHAPVIKLAMTDEDVVRKASRIMGGSVHLRTESRLNCKDIFILRLYGPRAIEVMKIIRPMMGLRRGQKIDDIVTTYELRPRNVDGKCKRGHDLTNPSNYYLNYSNGRKTCKQCQISRRLKVVS